MDVAERIRVPRPAARTTAVAGGTGSGMGAAPWSTGVPVRGRAAAPDRSTGESYVVARAVPGAPGWRHRVIAAMPGVTHEGEASLGRSDARHDEPAREVHG
ncbi:hypothetical protein GCM10010210_06660 [Pseudonocardia hydrocarbonoxydans]|uniref:Uncharacterized protein n=1 Tax=Pseudonocardia hydrocarbonoxydans TaxID=76726 RepID=A0A4Y3WQN7_9PSEU|nr:hypothetical protein PHY01_28740 [Pseudonocardia hydrocarbonoxydans]